jgi:hypothetical protein
MIHHPVDIAGIPFRQRLGVPKILIGRFEPRGGS